MHEKSAERSHALLANTTFAAPVSMLYAIFQDSREGINPEKQNYSTGIVAVTQVLCYDSGDRADQFQRKERTVVSKHVKWIARSINTIETLPCDWQGYLCVRPKQTCWHSTGRSHLS